MGHITPRKKMGIRARMGDFTTGIEQARATKDINVMPESLKRDKLVRIEFYLLTGFFSWHLQTSFQRLPTGGGPLTHPGD